MWDILYYLLIVCALAAATVVGAFGVRAYLAGHRPMEAFGQLFQPRAAPRIDLVETSNVDGRRKLILIRRDDVEHLIMTGGPVDVVIETGIQPRPVQLADVIEGPATVSPRVTRAK